MLGTVVVKLFSGDAKAILSDQRVSVLIITIQVVVVWQ